MKLALYAHPFDLDALEPHGGLRRLADLGVSEIAMATSYHDGRWLQPWHPKARVRFLEDGTVHFRPGDNYGQLQPLASAYVLASGPSPLERLCSEAPEAGIAARAWNVFTHNSRLGTAHPELCVQNAFGDRYIYALCPAQPEVQRYVLGLVSDLAAHTGLSTIELEAFGWMGWKHGSHHDKASFAPKGLLEYALSHCFCAVCCERVAAAGGDPERNRAWARELYAEHFERGDAMSPLPVAEDALSEDALPDQTIVEARRGVMREMLARVRAATELRLAAQVHPSPLFSGSQLPMLQVEGLPEECVITAYGEGPAGIEALLADELTALMAQHYSMRLSIWPKAPQFTSDVDLVKVRDLCVQHGISSVAIYHLGLLPWRTIERAARIFAE